MPPLLQPLAPDAAGVNAALMVEIAAVIAVVSDWPLVHERKSERVNNVRRSRIVTRLASWQEFWGSVVVDPAPAHHPCAVPWRH